MSAPAVSDAGLFPEASLYFTAFYLFVPVLSVQDIRYIGGVTHGQSCLGLPILSGGNIIGCFLWIVVFTFRILKIIVKIAVKKDSLKRSKRIDRIEGT